MARRGGKAREAKASAAYGRMPDSFDERTVLVERLDLLVSEVETQEAEQHKSEPVVLFRLGEKERYALLYRFMREVVPRARVVPVPCTPPHIAGVLVHHGALLTVLDTRQFFRCGNESYGADASVLVVEAAGVTVGLLTDEVLGHAEIETDTLAPPLPSERVANLSYVAGIHGRDITVLDVERLAGDPGLVVDERAI